jgi:hypothetical protein
VIHGRNKLLPTKRACSGGHPLLTMHRRSEEPIPLESQLPRARPAATVTTGSVSAHGRPHGGFCVVTQLQRFSDTRCSS